MKIKGSKDDAVIMEAFKFRAVLQHIELDAIHVEHDLKCLKEFIHSMKDETCYQVQEVYLHNIHKLAEKYGLGSVHDRSEVKLGEYAVHDILDQLKNDK